MNAIIFKGDMAWKLGELQSVNNELGFGWLHVHKSFEILFININQKYGCVIGEAMLLDDCFVVPKIYCFHRVKDVGRLSTPYL